MNMIYTYIFSFIYIFYKNNQCIKNKIKVKKNNSKSSLHIKVNIKFQR